MVRDRSAEHFHWQSGAKVADPVVEVAQDANDDAAGVREKAPA